MDAPMSVAEKLRKNYPELSDSQLEIIGHTYGPLLIIAGPGSGKTLVLVMRALNIHLQNPFLQRAIARYLANKIGKITAEKRKIEFEEPRFKLSQTRPFVWRRRHIQCDHTIFNYVATYNDFESKFANFLNKCPDILRFATLAEHFTRFRVDYLSASGAIKFYYPDFVAIQRDENANLVNWIIETKGRKFENLPNKEVSIQEWCKKVSAQTNETWKYIRIDQNAFERKEYKCFAELLHSLSKERRKDKPHKK